MPVYRLPEDAIYFPDPNLAEEDGLLAVGGDLSVERLVNAYANGIFPWFNQGEPILWWSPNPRWVLFPEKFKASKSLKQSLRNKGFTVKINANFDAVIENCAKTKRKGQDGTWITPEMIEAYKQLHKAGYAHSVETYNSDNELVGGFYGVKIAGVFSGESMFSKQSDASKIALYLLCLNANNYGIDLIDVQTHTPHLESLGAEAVEREFFLDFLSDSIKRYQNDGVL